MPRITTEGCPIGTILMFGGENAPENYLLCNGASLLRADYPKLFAVIGTIYGAEDNDHFNLPDLRQRFPMGKAVSGTGATLGEIGGNIDHYHSTAGHALSVAELAAHTHTQSAHMHTASCGDVEHTHLHSISFDSRAQSANHSHSMSHTHTSTNHSHSITHSHTGPSHVHSVSQSAHSHFFNHSHFYSAATTPGTLFYYGAGYTWTSVYTTAPTPVWYTDAATPSISCGASGTDYTGGSSAANTGAAGSENLVLVASTGATSANHSHTVTGNTGNVVHTHTHTVSIDSKTPDIQSTGSSQAHNHGNTGTNNPPYLVINFIIKYK